MARGITQEQVNDAADAITADGERVTVEKVRAKLGTGSPNTITRMLDVWRQGLAARLRELNTLPGLPDEVGEAMTSLWSQALQHARAHTDQEIQAERDALLQSRSALDAREAERAGLLATAQAGIRRAEVAAQRAEVEITALRRLVERLEAEGKDHAEERARLLAQNQALETTCGELRREIRAAELRSAKGRAEQDERAKVMEDRAHAQVDRARTELKAARAELAEARKQHREDRRILEERVAALTKALSAAEREASRQCGIAEALTLKRGRDHGAQTAKHKRNTKAPRKRTRAAPSH